MKPQRADGVNREGEDRDQWPSPDISLSPLPQAAYVYEVVFSAQYFSIC